MSYQDGGGRFDPRDFYYSTTSRQPDTKAQKAAEYVANAETVNGVCDWILEGDAIPLAERLSEATDGHISRNLGYIDIGMRQLRSNVNGSFEIYTEGYVDEGAPFLIAAQLTASPNDVLNASRAVETTTRALGELQVLLATCRENHFPILLGARRTALGEIVRGCDLVANGEQVGIINREYQKALSEYLLLSPDRKGAIEDVLRTGSIGEFAAAIGKLDDRKRDEFSNFCRMFLDPLIGEFGGLSESEKKALEELSRVGEAVKTNQGNVDSARNTKAYVDLLNELSPLVIRWNTELLSRLSTDQSPVARALSLEVLALFASNWNLEVVRADSGTVRRFCMDFLLSGVTPELKTFVKSRVVPNRVNSYLGKKIEGSLSMSNGVGVYPWIGMTNPVTLGEYQSKLTGFYEEAIKEPPFTELYGPDRIEATVRERLQTVANRLRMATLPLGR